MLNVEQTNRPTRRLARTLAATVLAGICTISLLTAAQPAAAATGPALYVSPSGDDSASGSLTAPLRTLAHARDVVRGMTASMQNDITVYLRGGNYPVDSTVSFGAQDSGQNGHRVVYAAYPGETPVLEAGVSVTGWKQHAGQIWEAPLSRANKLRSLYIDGTRAVMAHKSVQGKGCAGDNYKVTAGQASWAWESGEACDGEAYSTADVPAITRNATDLEVQGQTTWSTQIVSVRGVTTSADGSSRVLQFQQPGAAIAQVAAFASFQAWGQPSHVLSNAYEFLDEPGEFFFDREAQKVYVYVSPGQDLTKASVYAPNNVETILNISGTDRSNRIHDVSFTGITIRHSDWNLTQIEGSAYKQTTQGNTVNTAFTRQNFHAYTYRNTEVEPAAVEVNSAANIDFVRNRVEHTGSDGVGFVNDVVNSRFEGNVTNDIGGTALNIGDPQHVYIGDATATNREHYSAAVEGAPTNISVRDNYFYDSAELFWGSAAVTGYFLDTVSFEYNRIEKTSWAGFSVGWGWWNFDGSAGSINPGNPTTVAKNNSIKHNEIIDTMRYLSDSGPIYTLGNQPGTVIDDNYARGIRPGHTYGLHPDEGSANISYNDNVIEADRNIAYVINSGNWGYQHDLQIRNTWGPSHTIYERNVKDSTVEDVKVIPDLVWPLQAYNVASESGVRAPFRDILSSVASSADFALPASVLAPNGLANLTVRGVGDASRTMWLAPEGTKTFVKGATMTSAPGNATQIPLPSTNGKYKLFIVDANGTVSSPSKATVDRTAPRPVDETIGNSASKTCMDVPSTTGANGTRPILWTCSGAINQTFSYTADKEIRVYANKCLDAKDAGKTPGTPVHVWDCFGAANQKWTLKSDGSIVSDPSGLCLSTVGGNTGNNTQLELATCSSAAVQKWTFPTSPYTVWGPSVSVLTSSRCVSGKVALVVQVDNKEAGAVDVTIDTPYGSKTLTGLAGGKTSSNVFNTRTASMAAGSVKTTANFAGKTDASAKEQPYDAKSCS